MIRKTLEFKNRKFVEDIYAVVGSDSSLRDIAAKTDVSASTLSRIQSGRDPDMKTFLTLCQALELDPSAYFGWYKWRVEPIED